MQSEIASYPCVQAAHVELGEPCGVALQPKCPKVEAGQMARSYPLQPSRHGRTPALCTPHAILPHLFGKLGVRLTLKVRLHLSQRGTSCVFPGLEQRCGNGPTEGVARGSACQIHQGAPRPKMKGNHRSAHFFETAAKNKI